MHVAHVIRDLDSASGGPSRSLPALLRGLSRVDPQMHISALYQDRGNEITVNATEETSIEFLPVDGGSTSGPFRIRKCLEHLNRKQPIDLIHLHGIWSPSIHLSAGFARRKRIPYIVTPRGMLSGWCLNNKSMRKRVAWWSYQQRDLRLAACIQATSGDESADIRSTGLTTPVVVIPHGCDLPSGNLAKSKSGSPRLAICISRIHPVKGLSELLDAWAEVRPSGWQLVIAGPDTDGYREQLRQQVEHHRLHESVQLIDAVDGKLKWDLLAEAELFISASHSENFGMSIAESLAAGTPVITTQGTPWEIVVDRRCGWWVPVGQNGLAESILEATRMRPDALTDMGQRGTELIQSCYSWNAVASQVAALYDQLLERPKDSSGDNFMDHVDRASCLTQD